jgi:hypothetical protein
LPRSQYDGPADFLTPDGTHLIAQCHASYRRERWQGTVQLAEFERSLERGDVCRLTCDALGELRVVILDRAGTRRYEFVALVTPDPLERL